MRDNTDNTNKTVDTNPDNIDDTPKLSTITYLEINVDVSELIPGYKLFFQSRYQEALQFFESNKDTDIRFLIGYTKTLLAFHQIEYIKPFNILISACLAAVNRTLGMIGVSLNKQTSFEQYLPQINELDLQQRQLFFWAAAHCCQFEFFLNETNITMKSIAQSLINLLKAAKINPAAFDIESYYPGQEFSNELKVLFSITVSEDTYKDEKFQEEWSDYFFRIQNRKDKEQLVQESSLEKELTLSNSQEIEKAWIRVCITALVSKDNGELPITFRVFQMLEKMLPQFDLAYQFHADALILHDFYWASQKYNNKAIELNPLNVVALNNKGYSYESDYELFEEVSFEKNYHRAIQSYQAAIEICPTYHIFHTNISTLCYQKFGENNLGIHYALNSLEINCEYNDGFELLLQFLSTQTVKKSEKLQSYINRSTVLLQREDLTYFRKVFMKFQKSAPLLFQGSLQDSLQKNFIATAGFIITTLQNYSGNATPVLKSLEEQARALLTILVYSKHLKQEFIYQPSCFYWELFLL